MKRTISFVPLLMLISCAGVKTAQIEHDGHQAYKLTCNEFNSSLETCKSHAEQLCANGYKLISHYEEVPPDPGDGFYMPSTHHLKIRCS